MEDGNITGCIVLFFIAFALFIAWCIAADEKSRLESLIKNKDNELQKLNEDRTQSE